MFNFYVSFLRGKMTAQEMEEPAVMKKPAAAKARPPRPQALR